MAVLALPMARGSDAFQEAGARVGGIAFLALVAGIVLPWTPLVSVAAALAGGLYAVQLAVADDPLDIAAPGVAAGLLLCAELAFWSIDEREHWRGDAADGIRRAAFVALLGAAALLVATALLVVADAVRVHGLAFDLLGIAAASALFGVLLATRTNGRDDAAR